MVGPLRQLAKAFGQFSGDEHGRPIGGPICDVEVHVVYLDVPEVLAHDLGQGAWSGHHDRLTLPLDLIELVPPGFEEFERLSQVGAQLWRRAVGAGRCSPVGVVPGRVHASRFAHDGAFEEPRMGLGLVRDVRDEVTA